jgi:hypothetical protein
VIPVCPPAERFTVGVECSNGPITQWTDEGRSVYEGLLVKVQKRLSHRYLFAVNYALQNLNATNAWNLLNFNQGYGPTIPRQNLGFQATVNLPWGFTLSMNSSIVSRTPVEPTIGSPTALEGTDINSAGGFAQALPGLPYDCAGISCGKGALVQAVSNFNATYAGTKDSLGNTIPALVLPKDYQFGDPTYSQDFRLTKVFTFRERYKFSLSGEMFNAFNIANLSGYNFTLDTLAPGCSLTGGAFTNCASQTYGFGQPTQRAFQTFGSGGPRAVQVSGRVTI